MPNGECQTPIAALFLRLRDGGVSYRGNYKRYDRLYLIIICTLMFFTYLYTFIIVVLYTYFHLAFIKVHVLLCTLLVQIYYWCIKAYVYFLFVCCRACQSLHKMLSTPKGTRENIKSRLTNLLDYLNQALQYKRSQQVVLREDPIKRHKLLQAYADFYDNMEKK